MHPRQFALWGGIVMAVIGAIAFLPTLSTYPPDLPALDVNASYGLFLNTFPMNVFNKVAMIALGLAGVWAANMKNRELPASIQWSRWVAYVTGALAVLGLIPQTNTLFGYWPLFGGTIAEHAVFAALGAFFGFYLTSKVPEDKVEVPNRESLTANPSMV